MATADRKAIVIAALWTACILISHFASATVVIMVVDKLADRALEAFDQLQLDMPEISVLAFQVSDYCRSYWYTLSVFFVVDAVLLFGCRLAPPKWRWSSDLIAVLGFITCILWLSFESLAMSLPLEAAISPRTR